MSILDKDLVLGAYEHGVYPNLQNEEEITAALRKLVGLGLISEGEYSRVADSISHESLRVKFKAMRNVLDLRLKEADGKGSKKKLNIRRKWIGKNWSC